MRYSFLLLGALFGFLLSRAGATTYDYYAGLFLFENLQLFWVIGTAAGLGVVGTTLMQRFAVRAVATRAPIVFRKKPMKRGLLAGSLLFGAGWGLAGACPGTALAMLGEGKLMAGFAIVGILIGTWLYGWQQSRSTAQPPGAVPSAPG